MNRFSKLYLIAAIPTILTGCGYNTIQRHDEQAAQAKQQIDVQLQRRADLVPNLVATVKGYAKQEETIFIEVARARSGLLSAIQSGDASEAAAANAQLTGALGRLLVTVEAYPQLKSDQNFLRLQDELAGTENRIAVARTDYNAAVNQYNAYIRTLPQKLTAIVTGAKAREYFNAPAGTETPPQVDFTR
ncbi:MAG: LemA family protein [Gemmatimonadaceae bacterium]